MREVMVVEDHDDIREALVELIENSGYPAVGVRNGMEALQHLEDGHTPGLIVLDLMLPVMSGWEFRRRQMTNANWSSIPIVLVSGVDHLEKEATRLQAIAFITKPFNFDKLLKVITERC